MDRHRAWTLVAGAFLATSLPAQAPPTPVRLIEARGAETLRRDLEQAARDGYGLLGAAQGSTVDGKPRLVALLRRLAAHEPPREYAVIATSGNLRDGSTRRELDALGSAGYHVSTRDVLVRPVEDWWLPGDAYEAQLTWILERRAAAPRQAYEVVLLDDRTSFESRLVERRAAGFEVLALINSARRVRALLGRSLEDRPATASAGAPATRYRLLFHARRQGARRALRRAGREGYDLVASSTQSIRAPSLLLLERAAGGGEPRDFRLVRQPFARQRRDRLERKLNKLGAKGYRIVPAGLTRTDLALERSPGETRAWRYRVLSTGGLGDLERGLEQALERGERFVALFADDVETSVLTEAAHGPPPAPAGIGSERRPVQPTRPIDPPPETLSRALHAIDDGRPAEAQRTLEPLVAVHPRSAALQHYLGLTYEKQRRWELAAAALERALELDPGLERARMPYAWCLYYLGRTDAARRAFESYLAVARVDAQALLGLGFLEFDADRIDAARVLLLRALEALRIDGDPANEALVRARLADVELRDGRLEAARRLLVAAIELDRDNESYYFKLAHVLQRSGDVDGARRVLALRDELATRRAGRSGP